MTVLPRALRHAIALAIIAIVGVAALSSAASASPRVPWSMFGDPPPPRALPMTNDGGRAMRAGANLLNEAMRFIGWGNFTGTKGPWCADATSAWLVRTGHRPLASRMAGSALAYGPRTRNPKPGDLIVLGGRHGASHVGIFAGWDRGRPVMVSGNWSHRVSRAVISARAVAAFIRT